MKPVAINLGYSDVRAPSLKLGASKRAGNKNACFKQSWLASVSHGNTEGDALSCLPIRIRQVKRACKTYAQTNQIIPTHIHFSLEFR